MTDNPLLQSWDAPDALPPFDRRPRRAFRARVRVGGRRPRHGDRRDRRQRRRADVRQHDRRARQVRPRAVADRAAVLESGVVRDFAGTAGRRARDGAAARRASERHPAERRAVRAHRRAARPPPGARTVRRASEASRPRSSRFHARRRAPRAGREGAPRRDRREARGPVDAIQPERAGRRSRVRARAARRARPRRTARARPARRARSRDRARQARCMGDHAVALADRAVSHVLRPPRPPRAGVPRVDAPRRERRRARQPSDRAHDPRAAPRAGDVARPQDVRGLRARRPDGRHAGRGRPAARPRVGPGEGQGAAGARRAACARAVARREHRDRAVGLALLRGKGAQGALRFRRSRAEALFSARPDARTPRSIARTGSSVSASWRSRT